MKRYVKPDIFENNVLFEEILLVSMDDGPFDFEEEGVFDEVWK